MPYFLVMIINLNTTYGEFTTSLLSFSRADSIAWAPWVMLWIVHDRLWSTTSAEVSVFLPVLAYRFPPAYSKRILVLLSLGLDRIE
jgi:hypothetical protein